MNEYVSFQKMITPALIQIIFWIMLVVAVITALGTMFGKSLVLGLIMLVLGPIMVRVYCELLIVVFRINENLAAIRQASSGAAAPAPPAPPAAP